MTSSLNSHPEISLPAPNNNRLLILMVGVLAGFLSGLFGVGGGILIVPGLVLVARMDQRIAHGTSLAAVLPISAASLATYWVHDHVDWQVAFFLAIGAIGGAILGTRLLATLNRRTLAFSFAGVLILSAIRLYISTSGSGRHDVTLLMAIALIVIGAVTGTLAGLLGVGGGIVMVPAMMLLLGITPVVSKGTSLAVIIPTAIMGTLRNRSKRNVDIGAAVLVGVAGITSAILGAYMSAQISDDLSNFLFASLLVVVAIRLLLQLRRENRLARS